MPFDQVHPALLRALARRGYSEPTPVQAAVLAPEAAGRDLLVSALTGSGKTVAYGLVMAAELLGSAERFEPAREPLALVMAPTRELAVQVHKELSWLFEQTGARIASCVGGMDIRREQRALGAGAHVVVGTPGRLCDHLERGRLVVSRLQVLVLDEADEMLELGFREELERVVAATPTTRRTLLLSATIPKAITALTRRFQRDALRIAGSAEDEPHGDIEYRAVTIAPQERDHAIVNVLRHLDVRGALVFCHTREAVKRLHANLLERGFSVEALSGELSQPERTRALQALRDGRARVCVATDVAARGLDLPDLGLVIHADLPRDRQQLLHRSGRTGRAGRKGVCVLLVPPPRRRHMAALFGEAHLTVAWQLPPAADEIRARDQERLVAELAVLADDPLEEDLAAARMLLARKTPEELGAALVRLHRGQLPAPEELTASMALRAATRPERLPRPAETVWFRMNLGRTKQADPRWIVPFLCKRGRITKDEIGEIRILDRETWFEIARPSAAGFVASVQRPDRKSPPIRIEPLRTPPTARARAGRS